MSAPQIMSVLGVRLQLLYIYYKKKKNIKILSHCYLWVNIIKYWTSKAMKLRFKKYIASLANTTIYIMYLKHMVKNKNIEIKCI